MVLLVPEVINAIQSSVTTIQVAATTNFASGLSPLALPLLLANNLFQLGLGAALLLGLHQRLRAVVILYMIIAPAGVLWLVCWTVSQVVPELGNGTEVEAGSVVVVILAAIVLAASLEYLAAADLRRLRIPAPAANVTKST